MVRDLKIAPKLQLPSSLMSKPPCIMCIQYIGGCSVHLRVFSTSGGYHEYIGGISWVHWGISSWIWGDTMSTSGDVQYIGGIPWIHWGDIMSTSGDVQHIRGISWYIWGSNLIKSFQFLLKLWCTEHPLMYWTSPDVLNIPRCTHDIPRCTHDIPLMYLWYPPNVLNIPWCTHGIPHMYHDIPHCTEHPPMYSWYPPMYSWYPSDVLNIPDVLMVSLRCTHGTPWCIEHPPDVLNILSPDVLNTHYTGWN